MVDLQSEFAIASVVIFNRQGFENRNKNMDILLSSDMMAWSTVYSNFKAFGGIYDENPLVCQLNGPKARFVRVQCRGYAVLHFDQLEVYAFP